MKHKSKFYTLALLVLLFVSACAGGINSLPGPTSTPTLPIMTISPQPEITIPSPTPVILADEEMERMHVTLSHLVWRELLLNVDSSLHNHAPEEVLVSINIGKDAAYILDFSISEDTYHILLDQTRYFPVYGLWLTDEERANSGTDEIPVGSFAFQFDPAQELEALPGTLTEEDIASLTWALEYGIRQELDRGHGEYENPVRYLEGYKKQRTLVQVYESRPDSYSLWFALDDTPVLCAVERGPVSGPYGSIRGWWEELNAALFYGKAEFVGEFYFTYDPDCEVQETHQYFDRWPDMREEILEAFFARFDYAKWYPGETVTLYFVKYTELYAKYPGDYFVLIATKGPPYPEVFEVFYNAEEDYFFLNNYTYITKDEILAMTKKAFDKERVKIP